MALFSDTLAHPKRHADASQSCASDDKETLSQRGREIWRLGEPLSAPPPIKWKCVSHAMKIDGRGNLRVQLGFFDHRTYAHPRRRWSISCHTRIEVAGGIIQTYVRREHLDARV